MLEGVDEEFPARHCQGRLSPGQLCIGWTPIDNYYVHNINDKDTKDIHPDCTLIKQRNFDLEYNL